MTRHRRSSGCIALGLLLCVAMHENLARAETTKLECADAYERAQHLDQAGSFVEAREQLLICGSSSCPAHLQRDCVAWLAPLTAKTPTIVVSVRDAAGQPRLDAGIAVDGVPIPVSIGRAVPVNPGRHALRVEVPGTSAVTKEIVAREGFTNQAIEVTFERAAASPAPPPSATVARSSTPVAAWVAGAVGVAGLAGFAYFGSSGRAAEGELDRCTPRCSDDQVDRVQTRYLLADLSLVTALVAGGAAVWLFVSGNGSQRATDGRRSTAR